MINVKELNQNNLFSSNLQNIHSFCRRNDKLKVLQFNPSKYQNVIKNGILGFTETKEALRQVVKNAYMDGNQSWLDASH